MVGLWAVLCLAMILFASLGGYGYGFGGRALAASFVVFVILLGGALLFAARGVLERVAAAGSGAGWLAGAAIFLAYLMYVLGTGTFSLVRVGEVALFLFFPLAVLWSAGGAAAGAWQDFFVIAGIWIAVKFGPSRTIWPYPGGRLSYILTILMTVNLAIAGFLLLRRMKGAGYSMGWGSGWALSILASLLLFACVAIPLGVKLHFIAFDVQWHNWKAEPALALGILFFTAWPEEFLFRGLLQNCLERATKSDVVGWLTASVLFGFSHITNGGFPNWRYVILASIAGFFYGWTWRRTGSIFASALVHAAVDVLWHFLFRAP
jgi:membrane protease YdiL (CAAX protease family)